MHKQHNKAQRYERLLLQAEAMQAQLELTARELEQALGTLPQQDTMAMTSVRDLIHACRTQAHKGRLAIEAIQGIPVAE